MSVGPAGALNPGGHPPDNHVPNHGPTQVADQSARTEQNAESKAKSVQFLPINANVPVQLASLGHNGGKTTQSNNSSAKSAAGNVAFTRQSLDQHQVVKGAQPDGPKGPHKPEGPKGPHKPEGPKDHGPKPHGPKDHGWKDHGPKDGPKGPHGPQGPDGGAFQGASQKARTDQNAESRAKSEQFLPVNANVPVQILSLAKFGGKTTQSNNSEAKSVAGNAAFTGQHLDQHQVAVAPRGPKPVGPQGSSGWKSDGPKGPQGPKGPEGGAFQGASQQASTDQNAESEAKSVQVAPINLNAPIQVLSLGHNGGDTTQSNNSAAKSAAGNLAVTDQNAGQSQQAGSGPAFQGASQQASTDQNAESEAKSEQIAPINVNAPVQILSVGSNGGDTTQSNNSSASSAAGNLAGTSQSVDQSQGLAGLPGLGG